MIWCRNCGRVDSATWTQRLRFETMLCSTCFTETFQMTFIEGQSLHTYGLAFDFQV